MKTLNEHIGELNNQLKGFSLDKIPSKCLYPNCTENAIYSHSIQENGILDKLEDYIEKEGKKIFSIEDFPAVDFQEKQISSFLKSKRKLRSFGKNDSSGLYMFCPKHDKEIFKDIEDVAFQSTQRQLFLHSIRAYLYDTRKAVLFYSYSKDKLIIMTELNTNVKHIKNGIKTIDEKLKLLPDTYIISKIDATSFDELKENDINKLLNLKEAQNNFERIDFLGKTGKEVKAIIKEYTAKLNDTPNIAILTDELSKNIEEIKNSFQIYFNQFINLVASNSINSFEYKTWRFKMNVPIAGSFVVRNDNQSKIIYNGLHDFAPLFSFTIFPNKKTEETIIILSSLQKDDSRIYFSRLNTLTDIELQYALSNIITHHGTNTYISPRIWNKFSEHEKDLFINRRIQKSTFPNNNIDYSLNLFSEKFQD